MKSVFAATAIALTLSTSAFAATEAGTHDKGTPIGGTVHFTGFITDTTCSVNGADGKAFDTSLAMGTYLSSDFEAIDDTTEAVPLNLELTNCPPTVKGVTLLVTSAQGAADDDYAIAAEGTADAAQGVAIRLHDDQDNVIAYGEESKEYSITEGQGSVDITAQYVATMEPDAITAGQANMDATFQFNYK